MEVNHLRKDELVYELFIRGVQIDESSTLVSDMRSSLRSLVLLEKSGQRLTQIKYTIDFEEELTKLNEKVTEHSGTIKEYVGVVIPVKVSKRLRSRLNHLMQRVDRLDVSTMTTAQSGTRSKLLSQVLVLLDVLNKGPKVKLDMSALFSTRTTGEGDDDSNESTSSESDVENSLPAINSTLQNVSLSCTSRSEPVYKWNLKFSGESSDMSINQFLDLVDEKKSSRRVSPEELFDSAIDLFTGKALTWFRSNKSRVSNWTELSRLLRRHYQPPDYQSRLLKDILNRTQGSTEGIIDYLANMQALFKRYGTLSETAQLNLIIPNLAPFYAMHLGTVTTLEQLEQECLNLEIKKFRSANHQAPAKKNTMVEPSFAFVENIPRHAIAYSLSKPSTSDRRENDFTEVLCWRCSKKGHLRSSCPLNKNFSTDIHCFGCGKPNVRKPDCNDCNARRNSGNGNRSVNTAVVDTRNQNQRSN